MNLINFLGVGTVTATKQTGSNEIMFYLPGLAAAADGRTVAVAEQETKKTLNRYDEETTSTVLKSNSFVAKWGNMGDTNRQTSPDVREGSQVAIYQVTGQTTYYWTTYGVNGHTMRLERVVWGYQANPSLNEDTEFNTDNFYTITMDTFAGEVSLRTAQSNGEKSGIEIKVDAMNGKVMVGGTQKSYLVWDDHNQSFTYTNVDKSVLNVTRKKFTGVFEDSATFQTKEQFNILTKVVNLQCKQIAVEADSAEIRIGKTIWKGDIEQQGNYTQKGNYDLEGNVSQKGNYGQQGNFTSSGTITGMTDVRTALVSLNLHAHIGVRGGSDTSGPPTPSI